MKNNVIMFNNYHHFDILFSSIPVLPEGISSGQVNSGFGETEKWQCNIWGYKGALY